MAVQQEELFAMWVCPNRHWAETLSFPKYGHEPATSRCGQCGEPFIKRCPNANCPDPIFHPGDESTRFHRACGQLVPWLTSSVFIPPGLKTVDGEDVADVERRRRVAQLAKKPRAIESEETALARDAESRAGRKMRFDTTDKPKAGPRWSDTRKTTWDQLESGEIVKVAEVVPIGTRFWRFITAPVGQGMQDVVRLLTVFAIASLVLWVTGVLSLVFGLNIPEPPDLRRILGR